MPSHRMWALALAAVGAAGAPALGAGGPPRQPDDASKLAAKIDDLIGARLAGAKVKPADRAGDAVFLRRVSLDVVGKTPAVMDVRRFLADKSADKRAKEVERLLDTPGYANHFSNVWRDLLLPEAVTDINRRFLVPGMEGWLRKQFTANVAYDQMVRELLTLPLVASRDRMYDFELAYSGRGGSSPMSFYLAKEGKPEELASATARLFLGVRLECAQCHDHPMAKWTREQFWGQAAFFAGIQRPRNTGDFFYGPLGEVGDKREIAIPNTDRVAQAKFLDGTSPKWKFKVGARVTLADWVTAADNPFFARTAVNRMWAHFFGIGLVDPVDDFNDTNQPSHPELLDLLAKEFVAQKYDFKFLVRAITRSQTYQRASAYGPNPPALRLFARMPVKGLTGEQVFDSLSQATGITDPLGSNRRFFDFGGPRNAFLEKFAAQERRTEYHTSIPQALTLMNNALIADATHPERGAVIGAINASSWMTTAGRVEAVYLAVLSRKPRSDEASKFVRYVDAGGAAGDKKKALADVYWALLNSPEFLFNH